MVEVNHIDPKLLGQRLVEARKARGVTQEDAAKHLECSRPILIAIEKGTRPAKRRSLSNWHRFTGVRSMNCCVRANRWSTFSRTCEPSPGERRPIKRDCAGDLRVSAVRRGLSSA